MQQFFVVCFVFFLLTVIRSSLRAGIKWSVYISKSQRILCVSFSGTDSGLYIYHLILWSNMVHFSSFSLVHFKNGPEYLTRGTAQVFISLIRFLLQRLFSRSFLVYLRYTFFSFNLGLFDGVRFQYFQVLVIFLFSKRSDSFLFCQFYSFCCLSFSASHYKHVTFFYAKFHPLLLLLLPDFRLGTNQRR